MPELVTRLHGEIGRCNFSHLDSFLILSETLLRRRLVSLSRRAVQLTCVRERLADG